jgi:C-terminal processing protease CtpA/Prc
MSNRFWRVATRVAFSVSFGLSILAAGAFAPIAKAQEAGTASNGIVGIAISITAHTVGAPARLIVERVLPGSPAQVGGVQRGDEIVTIDDQPIKGKTLHDISHLIRGKVGTAVTLTIDHKGQGYGVSLTRVEAPPRHPHQWPHQPSGG